MSPSEGGVALRDRKALVTGAAQGIGREIAVELARCGAEVCPLRRSLPDETVAEIAAAGGVGHPIQSDLRVPGASQVLVEESAEALAGLDLLVNCAGSTLERTFDETSEGDLEDLFRLNVWG